MGLNKNNSGGNMDLKIGDGRGSYRAKMRVKNVKRVRAFFEKNPGALRKDCARELGLSAPTVLSIIRELMGN